MSDRRRSEDRNPPDRKRDGTQDTMREVSHAPPEGGDGAERVWDGTRVRPRGDERGDDDE